ncbi:outer membrane protein assembly factor BamE [Roseobacter weihaiensis]|uniref:outer membrane protein assembly factor BamE n=1 Tax=Roseobacter weihaiensis TaxID=2763262 RepID=UPI001D0AFF92|nr:outer membrane protein assembly factor BamE [Roseobacter sp. H9]
MSSKTPASRGRPKAARLFCVGALVLALSACSGTYRNHGYVPPQEDLEQIVVGIDTRSSVEETLGTAGSTSVLEDDALYFVRSRIRTFGMFQPEVVDRNVVAVSFDDDGIVANVETFGLERGQVIQLTRRVTDSSVANKTFLRQLLGNIGQFGPANFGS